MFKPGDCVIDVTTGDTGTIAMKGGDHLYKGEPCWWVDFDDSVWMEWLLERHLIPMPVVERK